MKTLPWIAEQMHEGWVASIAYEFRLHVRFVKMSVYASKTSEYRFRFNRKIGTLRYAAVIYPFPEYSSDCAVFDQSCDQFYDPSDWELRWVSLLPVSDPWSGKRSFFLHHLFFLSIMHMVLLSLPICSFHP